MRIRPLLSIQLALIAASTCPAAVLTIQPSTEAESRDTKIYASQANGNFSSNLNAVSADITDFRSLIAFDQLGAAGLTAGEITSATLRIYVTGLNTTAQSTATSARLDLLTINSAWRETASEIGVAPLATWNAFFGATPTLTVGAVLVSQTITGAGFVDFDITTLAQAWVSGTQGNYGVMIQAPGPNGDVGIADVDSAGAANAPALILNTIPEPGVAGLLLLGATVLGRRRR
jgi:hypothetical protein